MLDCDRQILGARKCCILQLRIRGVITRGCLKEDQCLQRVVPGGLGRPVLVFQWRVYVQRSLQPPAASFASTTYIIELAPQSISNQLVSTFAVRSH